MLLRVEKRRKPETAFPVWDERQEAICLGWLWENWSKNGKEIISCTIITTAPNDVTRNVHDRMPVILPEDKMEMWLDRSMDKTDEIKKLLVPYQAELMDCYEVSTAINSAKNEGEDLILPINSL